jgi:hypothetical protein
MPLHPVYARWFLIAVLSSLDDDIRDCHNRYLALPTLGWRQYIAEVASIHMVVRALHNRLDEVRREIEVCRQCT